MKEITISSNKHGIKTILVDDSDYEFVSSLKWKIRQNDSTYYAEKTFWVTELGSKKCITKGLHRMLLGVTDASLRVDHKDHNGLNNQRSNLRVCQHHENVWNTSSRKNSSSKYLGVSWKTKNKKWQVLIQKNGDCQYVGLYKKEEDAALAYNERAKELFGEFANLNVVSNG